jgi:hypothetical protein
MKTDEEKVSDLDFLPEAMVEEMLRKQSEVIKNIDDRIRGLVKIKENIRRILKDNNLIRSFADELTSLSYPTAAGVDGTRSIIRQLSLDTAAIAAIAVEGLIPPKEQGFWEKPHFLLNIYLLKHSMHTDTFLRHLMFSYELQLATKAPHKVVFLDGSFTSFLIGLGQGFELKKDFFEKHKVKEAEKLAEEIQSRENETIRNFVTTLTSPRVDQFFVAIPKYTSRNEVGMKLKEYGLTTPLIDEIDDKGLLSFVLEPLEYIGPLPLTRPEDRWHFTGVSDKAEQEIVEAMNNLQVLYFRPSRMHPALRVEVSSSVANEKHRLRVLLEALLNQTTVPGIMEPYPLYIADLFVKHVHGGLIELREAAIGEMGKRKELDLSDFYLALHDYRSERGYE